MKTINYYRIAPKFFLIIIFLEMLIISLLSNKIITYKKQIAKTKHIEIMSANKNSTPLSENELLSYEKTISDLRSKIINLNLSTNQPPPNEKIENFENRSNEEHNDFIYGNKNSPANNGVDDKEIEIDYYTKMNFISYLEPLLKTMNLSYDEIDELSSAYYLKTKEELFISDNWDTYNSDEEREADIRENLKEYKEMVVSTIGNDNWDKYEYYENSMNNRSCIAYYNQSIGSILDEQTIEDLVYKFYKIDEAYFNLDYPTRFRTTTEYAQGWDYRDKKRNEYFDAARTILPDNQSESFIHFYNRLINAP